MGNQTKDGTFAFLLEQGVPIGVTTDVFEKEAHHVKIGNKANEPIPVSISSSSTGVQKNFYGTSATTLGGGPVTLISLIVPLTKTWSLNALSFSCSFEARFTIKINSVVEGRARTGPGQYTAPFSFLPNLPTQGGDSIEIEVETSAFVPVTDADATLMLLET